MRRGACFCCVAAGASCASPPCAAAAAGARDEDFHCRPADGPARRMREHTGSA